MTRSVTAFLGLVVATVALTGCSGDASSGPDVVGTFVVGWSEAADGDAVRRADRGELLVSEPDDLDDLIDRASPELDTTELLDVDLDEHVLVVGSYGRCDESSQVVVEDGGSVLRFVVTKPNEDHPLACEWSPQQIDVWQVARDVLADDVSLRTDTDGER